MYDYIKQQHKSIKNQERERETETETERQRQRQTDRQRGMLLCAASNYLTEFVIQWQNSWTGQ